METTTRSFELRLSYRSDVASFTVDAIDVVTADNLVSLLSQFNVVVGRLHHRILNEEMDKMNKSKLDDDDIPF